MKQPIDCQLLIEQLAIPLDKFEAWKKEQLTHMNIQDHDITMNESRQADHPDASLRPPTDEI